MAKGSSGSMFLAALAAAALLFMQVLGYRRRPDAHLRRRAAMLSGLGSAPGPPALSHAAATADLGGTW